MAGGSGVIVQLIVAGHQIYHVVHPLIIVVMQVVKVSV